MSWIDIKDIIPKDTSNDLDLINDWLRKQQYPYPPKPQTLPSSPYVPNSGDINPGTLQWDEKVRGKRMSDSTGKVIWKYQMPVLERFTMKLPKGAEIIRVADQEGMLWLWAIVNSNAPDEERHFVAVKCGANVPEGNLKYIGFCAIFVQQELGLYIFEDLGNDFSR